MGGDGKMPYPKWVYSPTGGWYNHYPKNWKRNTWFLVAGYAVAFMCTFTLSASLERRPCPPRKPIPSQRWCKHAHEDDPSLRYKM